MDKLMREVPNNDILDNRGRILTNLLLTTTKRDYNCNAPPYLSLETRRPASPITDAMLGLEDNKGEATEETEGIKIKKDGSQKSGNFHEFQIWYDFEGTLVVEEFKVKVPPIQTKIGF